MLGGFASNTVADLDVFHEMATFLEAISLGKIPTQDSFSYVPTISPVVHHEWGTGAIFYIISVSSGLGGGGIIILKFLLVAAIAVGCYRYARSRGASIAVFAPLALVASILLSSTFPTNIRAQIFSLLFQVILFIFLEQDSRGKRSWIALWLPFYIIWLNMHAGFVMGIAIIGFYCIERFIENLIEHKSWKAAFNKIAHLLAVGLAMFILIPVNPYGFDYLPYLWRGLMLDRTDIITEWQPIWSHIFGSFRFVTISFFLLFIFMAVYAVIKRRLHNMPHIIFMTFTAWQTIWHSRFLAIFSIVWICCVPGYLENTRLGQAFHNINAKARRLVLTFWILYGLLAIGTSIYQQFWQLRIPSTKEKAELYYPVGAVDYLAEHNFKGNIMVPFTAGSYILWKLTPDVKVSLDSRFEVAYSIEWTKEQTKFYQAKDGWQETLTRYPTDAVLIPHDTKIYNIFDDPNDTDQQLITTQWRKIYTDRAYSIFARSKIANNFEFVDNTEKDIIGHFP